MASPLLCNPFNEGLAAPAAGGHATSPFNTRPEALEPAGPLSGCEPKGDNLLDWTAALRFPPESELQQGLEDWARASQLEPRDAVVRVRLFFPLEYPQNWRANRGG